MKKIVSEEVPTIFNITAEEKLIYGKIANDLKNF